MMQSIYKQEEHAVYDRYSSNQYLKISKSIPAISDFSSSTIHYTDDNNVNYGSPFIINDYIQVGV